MKSDQGYRYEYEEDKDSSLFSSPLDLRKLKFGFLAMLGVVILIAFAINAAGVEAGDIHYRNGVACYRKLYPVQGSYNTHRVVYEPVPIKVVEKQVEYKETPKPYPSERELLQYSDEKYQQALLRIIKDAQKNQSRRADIELLRQMGLRLDSGYSAYSNKSVYARDGYERPRESSYGISVKESVDYIGSDPTDVIAGQLGRQMDRVGDLFGNLTQNQSVALQDLIKSRAVNTERTARAIERRAEAAADAEKIRALGDVVKRTHYDRETNVAGTFLQALQEAVGGVTAPGVSSSNDDLQTIFDNRCGKCHDSTRETYQAGRLDLSDYRILDADQFGSVIKNIRSGAMPPEAEPQLTADEERSIVDYFVSESLKGD